MDDSVEVTCPACGESNTVSIDSVDDGDEFVQDCCVCCRPFTVRVARRGEGPIDVSVRPESE